MVLHHISNRPRFLIEAAAARHAELFGHRDLHAFNVAAAPTGFEEGIGETEVDEILDRLLSKVVIDPKDGLLREMGPKRAIERLR